MGLFNRKKETPKEQLNESQGNVHNYQVGGLEAYNFVRGLRLIASDTYNNDYLLDRMMDDATISAAVDMYIDDALQVDPQKKEIFWVEVENTDDKLEENLAKGLTDELNRFLKSDLRMDKELRTIARRYIQYGMCICRLDFIDKLEDDRLALIDKNKKIFDSVDEDTKQSRLVEKVNEIFVDKQHGDVTEALTELKKEHNIEYEDISSEEVQKRILESVYKAKNSIKLNESISPKVKLLKEDLLSPGKDQDIRRLIKGRWSAEIIGQGTNVWELRAKGKTLAYMDVRKPNFLLDPINLVSFSNNTGKYQVNFEVGPYNESDANKEYYTLRRGESYLDNARTAWQVLSALEDILMLTRMTRSVLYRIFSVEVGNKGDTETTRILNQLKTRIKFDETINVKEKVYNSDLRQIPLGDSIFIPTRNGIGNIDIKTVGGDVNLKDAIDLDYFKDKLFAALRIPKAFLGFSDEGTGGMINTSLTRMDIRYARTIRGIQTVLGEGLKDLCLTYLRLTRPESSLEELPDFKIVFTSINTEEDTQRNETRKVQVETLDKVLETFENLGVSVPDIPELRNELIREYIGSDYLEIIKRAEKEGIGTNPFPSDDEGPGGSDFGGGPSFDTPDFGGGPDLGGFESDIETEEPTEDEEMTGDLGAGDEDFEPAENKEPPSGLTRELNTEV